jgi:hypothetical protein
MALLRHPEYYQYEFISPMLLKYGRAKASSHPSFSTSLPKCLQAGARLQSSEARLPIQEKDAGQVAANNAGFPRAFSPARSSKALPHMVTTFKIRVLGYAIWFRGHIEQDKKF